MFKVTLRKMSYLVALMIAFLFSLAAPVAAMAYVEIGWSAHAQSYDGFGANSRHVSLNLKQSGEKYTVLGVYDVLSLIGGNVPVGKSVDKSTVKTDSMAISARYKDRPGWRL